MKKLLKWTAIVLLVILIAAIALSIHLNRRIPFPYPALDQLIFDTGKNFEDRPSFARPLGSEGGFRDFGGLLFGLRRLTRFRSIPPDTLSLAGVDA